MRPLWVEGRTVHQVGLPYHWGYNGVVTGDVVNDLLAISEEPNVRIMETKALALRHRARTARAWTGGVGATAQKTGAAGMSATITGFLTDSTLCIGCKACEVACKEWNGVAEDGLQLVRQLLRQHRRGRALDLAAREVRRRTA